MLICGVSGGGKGNFAKLALKDQDFKFISYGDLLSADFFNFYESPRQKLKRLLEEALLEQKIVILGNLEEFLEEPGIWFTLTTGGWLHRFKVAGLAVVCTMNSENIAQFNIFKDHFLHIITLPADSTNARFADLKAAKRDSEALQLDEVTALEIMVQDGRTCAQLSNRNGMLVDTSKSDSTENSLKLEEVYGLSILIKSALLEAARFSGSNPTRGALLYGPPGTGKTRLALALAGSLGKGTRFISVGAADLLRAEIGTSEIKLREIFALARASQPSIIFFDEIDALFPRNPPFTLLSLQHQLIAEFDSLQLEQHLTGKPSKVFVLAASNYLEKVEKRILGVGRFELQIEIGLPDYEGRLDIFKNELGCDSEMIVDFLEKLARVTSNKSPADLMKMIQDARKNSWKRSDQHPRLKSIDFKLK